jgi:hypothetical protein
MEKGHEIWYMEFKARSGALRTVAREIGRYKLDLVGVQEVRWDKRGTVRAGNYNFCMEEETKIMNWGQIFCTQQNSISS